MGAETQAVIDSAWAVANYDLCKKGRLDELRGKLFGALQTYAKAHPPERPKGVGIADISCAKCGAPVFDYPAECPCVAMAVPPSSESTKAPPLSTQPVFLRPQEGDVCVLAFPDRICTADRDKIAAHWERQVPGVKVVVVSDCVGVQSFRPAKGDEDVRA